MRMGFLISTRDCTGIMSLLGAVWCYGVQLCPAIQITCVKMAACVP